MTSQLGTEKSQTFFTVYRPMQILVVSLSYENYQNKAVSYQLTDVGRAGIVCWGDFEYVDV